MKKALSLILITSFLSCISLTMNAATFTDEEISTTCGMSELDNKPEPKVQVQPKVTKELEGIAGRVYVAFIVNDKGNVEKLRCVKTTSEQLREPVLAAVEKWKFKPGKQAGKAVSTRVVLPIRVDFS